VIGLVVVDFLKFVLFVVHVIWVFSLLVKEIPLLFRRLV
jgi:hypothetical protein